MKYRLMKSVACLSKSEHAESFIPVGEFIDAQSWWNVGPFDDINEAFTRAAVYNGTDQSKCPCKVEVKEVE